MGRLTRLLDSLTETGLRRSPFLFLWAAYLVPVVLLNRAARHQPFYWDAMGYVLPTARTILESGFDPILRVWDVGHPTAYYWLLAVFLRVFGVSPSTGHLFTWVLTAGGLAAVHRLGAALRLPAGLRVGTALGVLVFPLVFASSRQVVHDLGLAVFVWLALAAWSRRQVRCYLFYGTLAVLTKLYGVLLVPALWLAVLAAAGGRPGRAFFRTHWRELAWTAGPALAQGLFLLVRYLVRGPGLTVNWTPHSSLQPVWRWSDFAANWPEARLNLWEVSGLGLWVLVTAAVLASGAILRRNRPVDPDVRRTVTALGAVILVFAAVLVQVSSTMGRYVLPLVGPVFLLLTWGALRLAARPRLVLGGLAVLLIVFVLQWHPRQTDWLPGPVAARLAPDRAVTGHHLETDLRYQDVVDLMIWAARTAGKAGPPEVYTHWPLTSAFTDPDLGYVETPLPVREMGAWADVPADGALVVVIDRLSGLKTAPPPEVAGFELLAASMRGEVTAWVWRRPAPGQSTL